MSMRRTLSSKATMDRIHSECSGINFSVVTTMRIAKATLTRLLPRSTVINNLRGLSTKLTIADVLPFSVRIRSIWTWVSAHKAVSEPEKKPDRISRPIKPLR